MCRFEAERMIVISWGSPIVDVSNIPVVEGGRKGEKKCSVRIRVVSAATAPLFQGCLRFTERAYFLFGTYLDPHPLY